MDKNYYDLLDVHPTSTEKEIRLAYRQLLKQYNAELEDNPDVQEKIDALHEAHNVLSDSPARRKYDHQQRLNDSHRKSALSLHTVASHQTLPYLTDEQAYYVLFSVMPTFTLRESRFPLNICLVIDHSTSMKGERLQQVKQAINQMIDRLQPDDSLALVVFNDKAKILLESQKNVEKPKAKSIVSTINAEGGTEIYQGLRAGFKEIEQSKSDLSVNQIILLTDGQTYGDEAECLEQAELAGGNKVYINTIGIGSDWNEDLLDQIAALAGGTSFYIDSLDKMQELFSDTMRNLETVIARELIITIDSDETRVVPHEAFLVTPQFAKLDVIDNKIMLGALSTNQEKSIILEFRVKKLPLGEQELMRITVEGDMPDQHIRSWEWVDLKAQITDQKLLNAEIPSIITTTLSKLAIYKMEQKVTEDLKNGQISAATRRLQIMATQLFNMGEPELSKVALIEANQLARTSMLSPEGSKKIRYGTRAIMSGNTLALSTRLFASG